MERQGLPVLRVQLVELLALRARQELPVLLDMLVLLGLACKEHQV
jgi:hypothetical protein